MAAISSIALQTLPKAAVRIVNCEQNGVGSSTVSFNAPGLRCSPFVSVSASRARTALRAAKDEDKTSTFDSAQKAADAVEDTVSNVLGGAGQKAKEAGDEVGKRADAVGSRVEEGAGQAADAIGEGADAASRKTGETLRAGSEKAQEIGGDAEQGAKKLGSQAEGTAKDAGGALEDAGNEAKGAARDVQHDASKAADETVHKLKDTANEGGPGSSGRDFSGDATRDTKEWTESSDKFSDPVPKDGI